MKEPNASIKTILVVEDEPAIGDLCQRVLTGEGLWVDIAANGLIAQSLLAERQYDLCLVDIRTPEMNGKELYQWLKESQPRLVGRVVFTTGDIMSDDAQQFLEQAACPFLPKPFTPDELKAIVRETGQNTRDRRCEGHAKSKIQTLQPFQENHRHTRSSSQERATGDPEAD